MTRRIVALIASLMTCAFICAAASAEEEPLAESSVSFEGELNFIAGLPQGDFKDHTEAAGFGVEAFAGIGLPNLPIVLGAQLGGLVYGSEHRSEPLSKTIPDVEVDVATSNNILLAHLVARIQPRSWPVRPYLDGLIGLKYFYTDTTVTNEDDPGDEIASDTNQGDTAFSYGVGAGFTVPVIKMGDQPRAPSLNLSIGARYLFGEKAEYLKEGSIRRAGKKVSFEVESSETDLLVTHIGIGGSF
jgi:hypothetical protein